MQRKLYQDKFSDFFNSEIINQQIQQSVELLKKYKRIFFIGNGGSNSICSHMMEDYAKICKYQTFTFSDPALITCYANDYGYENAMMEWLKVYYDNKTDVLIAISSSGNSLNILNAVHYVKSLSGSVISLSGFKSINKLKGMGNINFWLDAENYGIVECFHQTILHIILDTLHGNK
jgi:D-sedoheptulose 7-phosphate isomerase